MLNILIIDDDLAVIQLLKHQIAREFPNKIHITNSATSLDEGITAISKYKPDLVFLDVQMPEKDGFKLFNELNIINFEIVFISSDPIYALHAFKVNALDYLLKPIQSEDIRRAIDRFLKKKSTTNNTSILNTNSKIGLPTSKGIIFVKPNDIIYCEASSNSTIIYFSNNKKEIISRTLKDVALALAECNFFRIQKSYLINFEEINQFIKTGVGFIVMNKYEDVKLPVSKFVREDMMDKLNVI